MTIFPDTWNTAYEAIPADNEDINLGASRIRDFKTNIRERVQVNHSFNGDANDGLHTVIELIPQSAPTPVNPGTDSLLYCQAIAGNNELLYMDSASRIVQLTQNGNNYSNNLVAQGTSTFNGAATFPGSILGVGSASDFELTTDGSGNRYVQFATNAYIEYNVGAGQVQIWVGGTMVAHFP